MTTKLILLFSPQTPLRGLEKAVRGEALVALKGFRPAQLGDLRLDALYMSISHTEYFGGRPLGHAMEVLGTHSLDFVRYVITGFTFGGMDPDDYSWRAGLFFKILRQTIDCHNRATDVVPISSVGVRLEDAGYGGIEIADDFVSAIRETWLRGPKC